MLYYLLFAFTESAGATVAGSFLDGVVAGALLVVGNLCRDLVWLLEVEALK